MMDESMNLYQRISLVMSDIQYLQKDDRVSTGASGSYKAMSEEKVTQTVRESLIKNGLVILPIAQDHRREEMRDKENVLKGYLSIVDTQYKIVDINTGQFEILVSSGTGADTQDKGVGKAMTYSYKYMLLRTFAIPTGDDPDKVSSDALDKEHEESKNNQPKKGQPKQETTTADPELVAAEAKWLLLGRTKKGFETLCSGQFEKGKTAKDINSFITGLLKKHEEEKKNVK